MIVNWIEVYNLSFKPGFIRPTINTFLGHSNLIKKRKRLQRQQFYNFLTDKIFGNTGVYQSMRKSYRYRFSVYKNTSRMNHRISCIWCTHFLEMPLLITAMANYVTCQTNRLFTVRCSTTEKQAFLPAVLLFENVVEVFLWPLLYFWLNVAATVVWLSSILPPWQLLLYVESPCGPLSSMASRDELGRKMQVSLFFWAKSSIRACTYTVWRFNVLFPSNLCRITASSATCLAVLSLKLQSCRNLSRLWKKSSINSSCLGFLVAIKWHANTSLGFFMYIESSWFSADSISLQDSINS